MRTFWINVERQFDSVFDYRESKESCFAMNDGELNGGRGMKERKRGESDGALKSALSK